jgi:acetyl-CoA C-acetyltransferase
MRIDPRTPVLAGVGQAKGDPDADANGAPDPIGLWADAARSAEQDAGVPLLGRVDVVAAVLMGSTREPDPGRAVALRLGIEPRRTVLSTLGGNTPQLLANELGAAIARGELDVALIGGAECLASRKRRRDAGADEWPATTTEPCAERIGDDRPGTSAEEMAHGMVMPVHIYPLLESAMRVRRGNTVEQHAREVSDLWARFAAVAATNPFAWTQTAPTAEEIRTPGPTNRMVCWPYPKLMCARADVDLGAALILCSYEAARAAGVADDRLVFLHSGADAHDHWFVSSRWSLAESPAIGIVTDAAFRAAGVATDDVARFDLYSCFPVAVELAMDAIGLRGLAAGDARPLTVTGGLGFAGGPLNNYVSHSIAAMAQACREDPGSIGVTTALGWYATKHSAGVWSTRPPDASCFTRVDPGVTQRAVDELPSRSTTGPYDGAATVEATEVVVDRDGAPQQVVALALTSDARRVVSCSGDADLARAAMDSPLEGAQVKLVADGDRSVLVGA